LIINNLLKRKTNPTAQCGSGPQAPSDFSFEVHLTRPEWKMVDYRKFDHIVDSDEESDAVQVKPTNPGDANSNILTICIK
jgi:hypothetical protein